jgi:hypothetical protein
MVVIMPACICTIIIAVLCVIFYCLLMSTHTGYVMVSDCISYIYNNSNGSHHINESLNDDVMGFKYRPV